MPSPSPSLFQGHEEFDAASLREHEEFTKVRNILKIELGRHEMDTWYFSPFPPEYKDCSKLYFCEVRLPAVGCRLSADGGRCCGLRARASSAPVRPHLLTLLLAASPLVSAPLRRRRQFTLAFFKRRDQLRRHLRKNEMLHPPGDEIYRHNGVSMFEVDGRKEKTYCQNLCYLAKLFLDHKTLYYDVDLFLFYVMCETDERGACAEACAWCLTAASHAASFATRSAPGCHIVGYFSKEKQSEEGYNLACILTLPPYQARHTSYVCVCTLAHPLTRALLLHSQRKGYGKFLISFSYELSKKEKKVGTPERPLSDLGLVSYRGYWTRVLLTLLRQHRGTISIKELSEATGIKTDDIIQTLTHLNMLAYQKGAYVIVADPETVAKHLKAAGSAGVEVDPSKLIWSPYDGTKEYDGYGR